MSIDFDPVRVSPRRRRFDPLLVGVVVIGVALVAAIVKPWEGRDAVVVPAPSGVVAVASPSPRPSSLRSPRPTPTPGPEPPAWTEIAPVVLPHEDLGVRAIVADHAVIGGTTTTLYSERWVSTGLSEPVPTVSVPNDDRAIVALGPTFPSDAHAVDARIWRVHAGGALEWVDTRPIEPEDPAGSFLFWRPGLGTAQYTAWPAGTYQMDVLGAGGIHRIPFVVPGRFGLVPAVDDPVIPVKGLIPAAGSDQSSIRVGLFATVDGHGVALPARESQPLDEDAAWLDVAGPGGGTVATAYLPRATGLGVMLTPNADVRGAAIRRLAPDGAFTPPPVRNGISESNNRTPDVYFEAPDGGPWPPGVYAISVTWRDGEGDHTGTWHVELRPGSG